jgi:GTP pyrophosphokinase
MFQGISTIEELLKQVPADGRDLVQRAYDVALRFHGDQKRQSGEPYILHPLNVASYMADLNMDAASIAAGLLHDVLEDTDVTREELAELFPDPIPELVQGVTKISRINFSTNREAQVENLRIMILAMARDIRVVIMKLCDRFHNMKTLKHLAPEKRIKISQETLDIYAPLANRLGMARIKGEMEDLSMRWLYPEAYQKLSQKIALQRKERERIVRESIAFLRGYLSAHFQNLEITGRPKHFYSIYRKMKTQGLTFDQIYDLNALRIICDEEAQCYEILGLIHALWTPMQGRIKDYIGMPKKNMYQSLHTTVVGYEGTITEIQIRTGRMHQIAEYGIAAHWKYKEQLLSFQMDERLAWLRQLTEWITDVNEPDDLLDALKRDVFADRVMCFTPRGDVVELPADATPIDFAYAIHTKVGEHCVGAKINNRMVNLRTKLQNGDVVEILTSSNGHPSRDWLDYVVSGRAKQKIKHWLKTRNIEEWTENGRRALHRLVEERSIPISQNDLDSELQKLLPVYHMQTVEDLLVEIGFGSLSPHAVLVRINPEWGRRPEPRVKKVAPAKKKVEDPIIVEGLEGIPVRVAGCCSPIPGDAIVGFVTRGRGVTVHQRTCRNIVRAGQDPEESARLLPARWRIGPEHKSHIVNIRVEARDREGLLNDLTGVMRSFNVFIITCNTRSYETRGTATLSFEVKVQDSTQVEEVLVSLQGLGGVVKAERRKRGA